MSRESDGYFRESLRYRATRLIRMLDLGDRVPAQVIAWEVAGILRSGLGLCGVEALGGEWLVERVRVGAGFCPDASCDGTLAPERTWLPSCERCKEETETEPENEEGP